MSFDKLPVELYEFVFGHLASQELPGIVLAVSRAIPLSPVPLHHLYHDIRLRHPDQAIKFYRHLRHAQNKLDGGSSNLDLIASWINELSIESWDVDAEVMINLFRLLGHSITNLQLRSLTIWIGPRNFAPEHLEKLFIEPLPSLQYLSLRFNPYVHKATYQQFLKGTYFDSTLKAIASWPFATLPALSVIQDPIDAAAFPETRSFAQPLVFFRLDLGAFIRSPALSSLKFMRFRIPARPVARTLCNAIPQGPHKNLNEAHLPNLKFLDLSTSGILEADIDLILVSLPQLEHLILDGCSLSLSGDLHDGEWHSLGKRLALIGVQRAREREKILKEWLEQRELSRAMVDAGIAGSAHEGKKIRPGRRGLATATISFRTPDPIVPSYSAPQLPPSVGTSTEALGGGAPTLLPPTPETSQDLGPANCKDTTSAMKTPPKATSTKIPVSKSAGTPNTPASAPRLDIKLRYEPRKSKTKKSVTVSPKAPSPPPPPPPPQQQQQLAAPEDTVTQPNTKGKHKAKNKAKKDVVKKKTATKIRVLPSLPSLTSLSLSLSSSVLSTRVPDIRREFEKGWLDGIAQLEGTRARLRISAGNSVRVMRLCLNGSVPNPDPLSNESDGESDGNSSNSSKISTSSNEWAGGLVGLEDVDLTDPDTFRMNRDGVEIGNLPAPVLCFSGPGKLGEHVDNCGHLVGWRVMKDDR